MKNRMPSHQTHQGKYVSSFQTHECNHLSFFNSKQVKQFMQKLISLMLLCLCCAFSFNAEARNISEDQALAILIAKIQGAGLYKSRLKMECLSFTNEAETKEYFDFKVHENHNAKHCSGDKSTAPTVDRFRVLKLTKKILWFEPINGKFVPFNEIKRR
jgi:hypothetical protein